jgi:hypothetical protein
MRVYVVFSELEWAVHSRVDASSTVLLQHGPMSKVVFWSAVFVNKVLLYRLSWLYCDRVVVGIGCSEVFACCFSLARVQRVARSIQAQTLSHS